MRSFLISGAMLFYSSFLSLPSMIQGLSGLFTSPFFVFLITAFLLRYRIKPIRIMAVVIEFEDIVPMLELDFANLSWLSILPIFLATFFMQKDLSRRANYVKGKATFRCF